MQTWVVLSTYCIKIIAEKRSVSALAIALLNIVKKLMEECQSVGEKIGVKFNVSIDHRIKAAISIKGHKPSTTQDLHAKRPLEIDPIIGSIIELGNKINVNTENLKSEYNKLKQKAEGLGLYKRSKIIDQITN